MKTLNNRNPARWRCAALALLLVAVLLLAACAPKSEVLLPAPGSSLAGGSAGSPGGTPRPRRTIPYAEMKYERPDTEAMKTRILELTALLAEAPDYAAVQALDEELSTLIRDFSTQNILATIAAYHDVTDSFYQEEVAWLDEQTVELDQLLANFNRALVEGPHAEAYRADVGDYYFKETQMSTRFTSPEVGAYQKEHSRLGQEYEQMMSKLTVNDSNGNAYTIEEIQSGANMMEYNELAFAYARMYLEDYAALYARMIELDKLTAQTLGFASAPTMYYARYSRDYSPADAEVMFSNIRSMLAPLLPLLPRYDVEGIPYQKVLSATGEALESMNPELAQAWGFMQEYGLYDMEADENKQPYTIFCAELPAYDAPFIFHNYDESFWAANAITHEFGHFYAAWLHYDTPVIQNLDITEIYSQGLEILMLPQHGLFTEAPEKTEADVLTDMLQNGLLFQSALEEFQLRAYELDQVDARTLGQLYGETMGSFGFAGNSFTDENGIPAGWFLIPHFFDDPFYTVSYVTSAAVALQLWVQSQSDWNAALETYQALIHANQNQPFAALLEEAGLRTPMNASVIAEISREYVDALTGEEDDLPEAA